MLKGNKGEWSEMYVLLKLLAEGKLVAANAELEKIENVFYPIIKILREEKDSKREFVVGEKIDIIDGNDGKLIVSFEIEEFIERSIQLFHLLKKSKGSSTSFPDIEDFLRKIEVTTLKAGSKEKADIRIKVHDLNTGQKPTLGFSIKSMLGKDSTLFNPGAGTNFIFKVLPKNDQRIDVAKFNADTYAMPVESEHNTSKKKSKILTRLEALENFGFEIRFAKVQSPTLEMNLQLIDSQLPIIISRLLYYKFRTGKSKLKEVVEKVKDENPLGFNLTNNHPFYEYKVKNFLTEVALGMTPEKVWTGKYDATGGIIIVKENGDVVCYHIYNRNEFQEYLLNNTKLEQASTGEDEHNPGSAKEADSKKYRYGWLYEEDGQLFFKLNLQIRFT